MGCSCAAQKDVEQLSFSPRGVKAEETTWTETSSSASASSRLSLGRVAAGHGGTSILKYVDKDGPEVPEIPEYVMKVWDDVEASFYKRLYTTGDSLRPFVPGFFGEVGNEALPPDSRDKYMRLSNVLPRLSAHPNVMDCKLGIRSFEEGEVTKTGVREDLYRKLVELDPSAPTQDEHQRRACTKYRWMSTNDAHTTLKSLGFRVDGLENARGKTSKKQLRQLQSMSDMARLFAEDFLPTPAVMAASPGAEDALSTMAARSVLAQLRAMRQAMLTSDLVRTHSFVGASLLIAVDGPAATVSLIDFAHTAPLPDGVAVDHRSPWKAGNHEDGLLLAMDNMVECWELVLERLSMPSVEAASSPVVRV